MIMHSLLPMPLVPFLDETSRDLLSRINTPLAHCSFIHSLSTHLLSTLDVPGLYQTLGIPLWAGWSLGAAGQPHTVGKESSQFGQSLLLSAPKNSQANTLLTSLQYQGLILEKVMSNWKVKLRQGASPSNGDEECSRQSESCVDTMSALRALKTSPCGWNEKQGSGKGKSDGHGPRLWWALQVP